MSSLSSSSSNEDSEEEYDGNYRGFERQRNMTTMKRQRSSSSESEDESPTKKQKGYGTVEIFTIQSMTQQFDLFFRSRGNIKVTTRCSCTYFSSVVRYAGLLCPLCVSTCRCICMLH